MKKGLVIVYDPHNLYQFLWYYASYGRDVSWTALCLPNGSKGEYMGEYCEKSKIFERVIRSEESFEKKDVMQKLIVLIQMVWYHILGKETDYCKKILNEYIDIEKYSDICVMTDVGIVSGAAVAMGQEKKVVIFEDGIGDYAERKSRFEFNYLKNPYTMIGFWIAKMGYSNPGHYSELKTTQYCIKYSSHPQKMQYQKYSSHMQLYDYSQTDLSVLDEICKRTYGDWNKSEIADCEAIVFTEAFNAFGVESNYIEKELFEYLKKKHKKILVKKHPLDTAEYTSDDELEIRIISNEIPGEVLIPYLEGKKIYFLGMSSLLMYMTELKQNIKFFYFEKIYEDASGRGYLNYPSKQYIENYIIEYGYHKEQIINIK